MLDPDGKAIGVHVPLSNKGICSAQYEVAGGMSTIVTMHKRLGIET